MATTSTPVSAWTSSIMAAIGTNQSTSLTVTVNITAGWEIQVPLQVQYSSVSADSVVNIYSTMDGGANYETYPLMSIALPSSQNLPSNQLVKSSVRLTTGQYAIQLVASGPSSESFAILTQLVISSIINQ